MIISEEIIYLVYFILCEECETSLIRYWAPSYFKLELEKSYHKNNNKTIKIKG